MGFTMDGNLDEELSFSSMTTVCVFSVQMLTLLLTVLSLVVYVTRSPLANKAFTRYMIFLCSWSTLYQTLQFLFVYLRTPPWLDWVFGWSGVLMMCMSIVTSMEVLRIFKVLSSFWTDRRITALQLCWIGAYVALMGGEYLRLGYMGRASPDWIFMWYNTGITCFAAACSIYDWIQMTYICWLLYRFFTTKRQDNGPITIPRLYTLTAAIMLVAVIDFTGLVLFAASSRREFQVIGTSAVNMHVVAIGIVFYELKHITLMPTETEVVKKREARPKMLLDSMPKSESEFKVAAEALQDKATVVIRWT
ncbi:hypothetical protein HDV03_004824 [Kappamyces sp. JEL0829]|nr:hypothetical protein HDV03_004824 [Kappamyces sp. JEL0829]